MTDFMSLGFLAAEAISAGILRSTRSVTDGDQAASREKKEDDWWTKDLRLTTASSESFY
jgi:hypothetical protein